jgi:UDP:flavonoid glycosyltransferase YjiC (YdhE family)
VAETGYGSRLATYEFEDGELLGAKDRLLTDEALRGRMAAIASRVQLTPGTVKAADLIERLARDGMPVTR